MEYIKTVLPSKRSDTQYPSDITPLDFNKFYTTVGVNLTRDLSYVQNIEQPFEIKSSFSLQSISLEFVLKKLLSFPSKSSHDQLHFDLKCLQQQLSSHLSRISLIFLLTIPYSQMSGSRLQSLPYTKRREVLKKSLTTGLLRSGL